MELCEICDEFFNGSRSLRDHQNEKHSENGDRDKFDEYIIEEFPEKKVNASNVFGEDEDMGYQGIRMTGSSRTYKNACTELRSQFVKGGKFSDLQGRVMTILDIPKGKNKAIEVEVTTLSKKPSEIRGKAKINMYEPKVKGKTKIMVNISAGSEYIFAQTVMMMFLKPFMDSIISEPDENPMSQCKIKYQNKTLENTTLGCEECGQTFKNLKGLNIHIGKMYGDKQFNESK